MSIRLRLTAVLASIVLPMLVFGLTGMTGYYKWRHTTEDESRVAAAESAQAARDTAVAMLSYTRDNVDANLVSARERLTGTFRDDYTRLINEAVIPAAKQKNITAVAQVQAAATISARPDEAVVLVFVNQTTTVADQPPTDAASTVRMTLRRIDGRWLVSAFEPI
jgi:Mce-associated membrane protein